MTKSIQSAVMHAVMKHAKGKSFKRATDTKKKGATEEADLSEDKEQKKFNAKDKGSKGSKGGPKETKGIPDSGEDTEREMEFEDEKPESAYQKYKEPKLKKKGKPKEKKDYEETD